MPAVLTVDQRDSRTGDDGVPALLDLLGRDPAPAVVRPFQRTVGDEVQAVLDEAEAVIEVVGRILRTGHWSIGLGVGAVEQPLPPDSRAGRGAAYLHARDAVTRAKNGPHRLCVVGTDPAAAERLETVLWLWAGLVERRTHRGWEVYDALGDGLSHAEAGQRLGVTQSAVTQRTQSAGLVDERRARRLATDLLSAMLSEDTKEVPR
ncbi:MAG: transposase [Nocardioidaceae bacterium]